MVDAMAPCAANWSTAECAAALAGSDNEFWLSSRPGGYLHTGLFNTWNLSAALGGARSYAVAAQSEADVQVTVAFAAQHNLRLVVKSTGHDWYGRSAGAGALVLWTHELDTVEFADAFVPAGCPASAAGPAATVGAGTQFFQLYPQAQARGRLLIGGTCDSVSVGGCWVAGCYGSLSRRYGSAASNLVQVRAVLANGTAVTASACSHPDLFWSLRGGGSGVAAVVTAYTARSHPAPAFLLSGGLTFTASTPEAFAELVEAFLERVDGQLQGPEWGGGGYGVGRTPDGAYRLFPGPHGYEKLPADAQAVFQPLLDFVAHDPGRRFNVSGGWKVWNASTWKPTNPLPWVEMHPDREISVQLTGSFTRHVPARLTSSASGRRLVAAALANLTCNLPVGMQGDVYVMYDKGQHNVPADVAEQVRNSPQLPQVLDSTGLLLVQFTVPSLPTLPRTAALLAALWPRLQVYIVQTPSDALWVPCAAGANGSATAAETCWAGLDARIKATQSRLAGIKADLLAAFPNLDAQGQPLSGAYWAETDYHDDQWQQSQWGAANYARLLAIKDAYDPNGLFYCHHCVGSERWQPDGNCPIA